MKSTAEQIKVFDIYNSRNQRLASTTIEELAKYLAGTKFTIRERFIDDSPTKES